MFMKPQDRLRAWVAKHDLATMSLDKLVSCAENFSEFSIEMLYGYGRPRSWRCAWSFGDGPDCDYCDAKTKETAVRRAIRAAIKETQPCRD